MVVSQTYLINIKAEKGMILACHVISFCCIVGHDPV